MIWTNPGKVVELAANDVSTKITSWLRSRSQSRPDDRQAATGEIPESAEDCAAAAPVVPGLATPNDRETRQRTGLDVDSFVMSDPEQRLQQARKLQRLILSSPQVLPGDGQLLSKSAIIEGQAWQELKQKAIKEQTLYAIDGSRVTPHAAATTNVEYFI